MADNLARKYSEPGELSQIEAGRPAETEPQGGKIEIAAGLAIDPKKEAKGKKTEDAVSYGSDFAVVCDGLSSEEEYGGGDVASSVAANKIDGIIRGKSKGIARMKRAEADALMKRALDSANKAIFDKTDAANRVRAAAEMQNNAVRELKQKIGIAGGEKGPAIPPSLEGMSTTASAIKFFEDENGRSMAVIGQVGDSEIFQFSGGKLDLASSDEDSLALQLENRCGITITQENIDKPLSEVIDEAVANRNYSEAQTQWLNGLRKAAGRAKMSDVRRVMGGALGGKEQFAPKFRTSMREVKNGDLFIACSDGLTDNVSREEIRRIVSDGLAKKSGLGEIKQQLMNLARKRMDEKMKDQDSVYKVDDLSIVITQFKGKELPEITPENFEEINPEELEEIEDLSQEAEEEAA